ncbi:MAG: TRAP-type mannitol/chloroaromatic compound transport system substrate-binding protein [Halieaceae bacterium]|jgi:TRAP-type mannitol/chloroaromatic compound transport system substrate-binding protein
MTRPTGFNREALAVLLLAAVLVLVVGLWAKDRAGGKVPGGGTASPGGQGSDQRIEWKLVTTWPKNLPGLGHTPEVFAQMVEAMSGGRLAIRVYGAGEIVPAFEVFDAVSGGVAQVGHGASYYWKGKIPSAVFFTAVPFGMTAQEMNGWLHYGGGMALWEEVYAPAGLVPLAGGSTGVQMAGWFNREINSLEDIRGLRMRIPGLAGDVFSAAGGEAVRIPGGEIYTALQTGVIDAVEWVGPYNDLALGLHDIAEYYYYPGWHEPGAMLEFIVNAEAMASLPDDLQAIVRHAARAANQDMLDEFTARNNRALRALVEQHGVKLRRLPDDVLAAFYAESERVMQRLVASDPMAAKVQTSFAAFLADVRAYHEISEQAYINARRDVMGSVISE